MKITKNQLRRIIREEKQKILAEQKVIQIVRRKLSEMSDGSHPLDAEVMEIDHNWGKSDVYEHLWSALSRVDDDDSYEAQMEFEQLEQYGFDTIELLDVLDNYPGLKDKVKANL